MRFLHNKKAFTLIELLAVVLTLGILSSIALPQYRRAVERTRVAEALTLLRSIYDARERLALEKNFGKIPTVADYNYGFDKLDISIKGTYGGTNNTILYTKNFQYVMDAASPTVRAIARGGSYSGSIIIFNGQLFSCSSTNGGCQAWGSVHWNNN